MSETLPLAETESPAKASVFAREAGTFLVIPRKNGNKNAFPAVEGWERTLARRESQANGARGS